MQNKNLIRGLNTRWGDIKLDTMLILDTISFALIAEDNLDMRSSEDLILKLQWKFFNSHFKKKTRKQYPIKDTKFCYWEFWVTWYMILISFLRLQNGWWSKLLNCACIWRCIKLMRNLVNSLMNENMIWEKNCNKTIN